MTLTEIASSLGPLPLHERRPMEIGRITPPSYMCLRTTPCKQQGFGAFHPSLKSIDLSGNRVPNSGNMYAQVEPRGTQLYRIKDSIHLQRHPLGVQDVAQNREGKSPRAPSVMPEGDQHMQAGKGRPVWKKSEAGEHSFWRGSWDGKSHGEYTWGITQPEV